MVSIMVNKLVYKASVKDITDKYYEMFRDRNTGVGLRSHMSVVRWVTPNRLSDGGPILRKCGPVKK